MTTQINQTPLEKVVAELLHAKGNPVFTIDEENKDYGTWALELKSFNLHYQRSVRIHPGTPIQQAFYVNWQQENGNYSERAVMKGANRIVTIRNEGSGYIAHIDGKNYAVAANDLTHALQDSKEDISLKEVA